MNPSESELPPSPNPQSTTSNLSNPIAESSKESIESQVESSASSASSESNVSAESTSSRAAPPEINPATPTSEMVPINQDQSINNPSPLLNNPPQQETPSISPSKIEFPKSIHDRSYREILSVPIHLRAFIKKLLPATMNLLDFSKMKVLDREFFEERWFRREADLIVEVPAFDPQKLGSTLICIHGEHQSKIDRLIAFRMLLYIVYYWSKKLKDWVASRELKRAEKKQRKQEQEAKENKVKQDDPGAKSNHLENESKSADVAPSQNEKDNWPDDLAEDEEEFKFPPVLPFVFYTGKEPWEFQKLDMHDLIAGSNEVKVCSPNFKPFFWSLDQQNPDELMKDEDLLFKILGLSRQDRKDVVKLKESFAKIIKEIGERSKNERTAMDGSLRFLMLQMVQNYGDIGGELMETAKQVYDQNFSYSPNESGSVVSPTGELFRYQLAEANRQGINQGLKQGMDQGLKQGMDQGLKQGEIRNSQKLLIKGCQKKFPHIDQKVIEETILAEGRLKTLEDWYDQLFETSTWEDFLRAKSN